jgi:hypothetical protein
MKYKVLAILLAIFFLVGIVGCGGYYMVKDPAGGNVYYTDKKPKEERGGAIKFTDKKTETSVTLQSSEVKKISKKEFKSALEAKEVPESKEASEMKEAPESKPATE